MVKKGQSGIYKITNLINNKVYVGSALHAHRRWQEHRSSLNRGKHHSRHLQRAWLQYGEQSFSFEIIESVEPTELITREQFWIDELKSHGRNGYNVNPVAASPLGTKRTLETRKKISQSKKGTDPWNKGITGGQKWSIDDSRWSKRAATRGKPRNSAIGKKISKTKKQLGQKPNEQALINSANTRRKKAELAKIDAPPKRKVGKPKGTPPWNKGKKNTLHRYKTPPGRKKGSTFTDEQKERIAIAAKLAWAKRKTVE